MSLLLLAVGIACTVLGLVLIWGRGPTDMGDEVTQGWIQQHQYTTGRTGFRH